MSGGADEVLTAWLSQAEMPSWGGVLLSACCVCPSPRNHGDAHGCVRRRRRQHGERTAALQHPETDPHQTLPKHVLHRPREGRHRHRGVPCAAGPGGE